MSSKLTMKDVMAANCRISNAEMLTSNHCAALARELNSILAAPVVERQPVAWRWEWKTAREYDGWCYVDKCPDLKIANLMDVEALYNEPPEFEELKTSLFKAIEHGDKGHRAWLKSAIDAHFSKAPMPDYVPSGKDNELAELQATIAELETKLNNAINLDFERRAEIERLKGGQGEAVTERAAYICVGCEGVYADHSVTSCDCMHGANIFTKGVIRYPVDQPAPVAVVTPEHRSAPADSGTHPHNDGLDDYRGKV